MKSTLNPYFTTKDTCYDCGAKIPAHKIRCRTCEKIYNEKFDDLKEEIRSNKSHA